MMNCKRARSEIALWVGDDLDQSARHELERHLAECPSCRDHRNRMRASLDMLYGAEDSVDTSGDSVASTHDSLWPGLSGRLELRDEARKASRFNGWVASLSLAAMVLAMVALSQNLARPLPNSGDIDRDFSAAHQSPDGSHAVKVPRAMTVPAGDSAGPVILVPAASDYELELVAPYERPAAENAVGLPESAGTPRPVPTPIVIP